MTNLSSSSFDTHVNYKQIITQNSLYLAIDWDASALHLRYQSTQEKLFTEHESVAICRKLSTEPVDLDHCLRAFTSEEKLDEKFHCSQCKSKQPATKKLQLWKLPPVLVSNIYWSFSFLIKYSPLRSFTLNASILSTRNG